MADTVAAIESAVSAELTAAQAAADTATAEIPDLLSKLNALSKTMFIPASPDLSSISYAGTTKSKLASALATPDIPASLDSLPQADTSVTYLDADYAKDIDTTTLSQTTAKFTAKAMAGMIKPSSIKVAFVYKDPTVSADDGGSAVIMLVEDQIKSGVAGYLTLDDSWASDSFNIGQERDAVELEKVSNKVQSQWAGLGYDSAPGMVSTGITEAYQQYLDKKLQQSQSLGIKQYDSSFAFRQAMISAASTIAGMAMSYADSVQNRALDAAKAVARFGIDQYNLIIARWANTVEIAKLPVDVATENLKLSASKAELAASDSTETYHLEALQFEKDSQKYKNDLTVYRETLRQFSQQLGLAEVNDRVVLMNEGITLQEAEMKARISLALAKLALGSLAETMSSEIRATVAGGKLYSNIEASTRNALSTLTMLENSGEKDTASST